MLAALLLAATAAAQDLPKTLTLAGALEAFRARGFDLLIADEAVASARADDLAASAIANPNLSASAGRSFGYDASQCPGCSATAWSLGVSDQAAIFDAIYGKRGLRQDVARAALEAAKKSRADAQRTLELQLAQALVALAAARGQYDVLVEIAESSAKTRALNERRLTAGAVSEADVARAEVQEMQALQGAEAARQAMRAAQVQLAFLLGASAPLPEFEADASVLAFKLPAALGDRSRDKLLADAGQARPDLQAALEQEKRSAASVDLARRQRWPDVTLSLNYNQEGSGNAALTPPTLTLGLSLPVPIFYRQSGEIAKAESDQRLQAVQRRKLEAQVASDVEGALAAFESSRARAERSEGRLLERAKRARDLVQVQYEKGAASLLDLLDAQRTYAQVAQDRLTQLAGYWSAAFALEAAAGKELSQ